MKRILLTLALLPAFLAATAQQISLEDVVFYKYYPSRVRGLSSMPDGKTYGRTSDKCLVRYSYADDVAVDTLMNLAQAKGERLNGWEGYTLSPDGKNILIETESEAIYRRSQTAQYYIYNVESHTVRALSKGGAQEVPKFSPDGTKIAFVRKNNLFYVDLATNKEHQVTTDGRFNYIINGKPDWVYEEEFEYNRAFDFSADSKMLAWVRFDETDVRTFSFQYFKGTNPEMTDNTLYPSNYEYKYPKAGEVNSKVSVLSYDLETQAIRTLNVPLDQDGYIPRIQFTGEANKLAVVTLNRLQNRCDIYFVNPRTGEFNLAVRETNDKYIETSYYAHLDFSGDKFILLSDRDGFNHLYLYDKNGKLLRQLTQGEFQVNDYYGTDGKFHYYASTETPEMKGKGNPLEQYIYKVDEKGKKTLLTPRKGTNSAEFSDGCLYFVNVFSDLQTPPVTTLCTSAGKQLRVLEDNARLKDAYAKNLEISKPELFSFTTSEGVELNGWMVKPANFDATKRYPVIMYQYSGPGNQQVHNSWSNGNAGGLIWEHRLAQKGYIVVCVDGRGTGGRGADFQKCTYMTMGDKESKDQVETALYLGSLPYVDKDRIAIWGWSFGGFNTIMSMCEGRPVFRCGVAVAPVTDWRFYDSAYTERYMRTPQENAKGYDISPLHRFKKLHGDLLICHGLADDNVHFQNAAELSEQLVQAGIQFEMQTYTNRNHSIFGGNTRLHLFTRIEQFFDKHLLK